MKITEDTPVEEIMTASEVARFLKVGVAAIRRWTREGKLKGHRLGGKGDWRYLRKDVIAFLMGDNN
ncbi:MAG: helix-turn-helix domain-containing protein [Dehalococcoidales bacterium]|nr:helix-turn-helix domain-containing protein [Dehalococcoidales bacterium]